MIRVTVELVPGGDKNRAEVIAIGIIANDGSGTAGSGNYNAGFGKAADTHDAIVQSLRTGRVEGFPRQRRDAWDLIYRALEATHGERNR